MSETTARQSWTAPRLTRFGTFVELTKSCDKTIGLSDGFTFQGVAIVCTSS